MLLRQAGHFRLNGSDGLLGPSQLFAQLVEQGLRRIPLVPQAKVPIGSLLELGFVLGKGILGELHLFLGAEGWIRMQH